MIANTRQLFLKSIIINIFLFLCSSTIVNAQNNLGEAKVECPDTVNIGTNFTYSITIPVDSTFHETVLPPFDNANVEIYYGPSLSTSTSISIVNGKINETHSRTYKYIVICNFAAPKNGKVDAPVQKMYFHHH